MSDYTCSLAESRETINQIVADAAPQIQIVWSKNYDRTLANTPNSYEELGPEALAKWEAEQAAEHEYQYETNPEYRDYIDNRGWLTDDDAANDITPEVIEETPEPLTPESGESAPSIAANPAKSTAPPDVTLTFFPNVKAVTSGMPDTAPWPSVVSRLREELGNEAEEKAELPCFAPYILPSGVRRNAAAVAQHTAIVLDVDHGTADLDAIVERLRGLGIAALLYTSPSDLGAGSSERKFRIIAPLATPLEVAHSLRIRAALAEKLGVEVDPSTVNSDRVYFVGRVVGTPPREFFDFQGAPIGPDFVAGLGEEITKIDAAKTERRKAARQKIEAAEVEHAAECEAARKSPIGRAFERAGLLLDDGNGGRVNVVCPWFASHSTGKPGDSSTVIFAPSEPGGIGGFDCKHSHCHGKTNVDALSELERRDQLAKRDGSVRAPELAAVDPIVVTKKCPQIELKRRKGGAPYIDATMANVMTVLGHFPEWKNVISWDEFALDVQLNAQPPMRAGDFAPQEFPRYWTDEDTTRLVAWLTEAFDKEPKREAVVHAVIAEAKKKSSHPVRAWLQGRERWDGVARVDALFPTYFGAEDSPYTRAAARCLMLGLVARAMRPGCKLDTMPILEGDQGIRKSTGLAALMPVRSWFSDTPIDFGSKDAYLVIRRKWLVEIAELDGFDKSDSRTIKAWVSSPSDNFRPPYGAKAVDHARQCAFAGTVNPGDNGYLLDSTGNRRFHPIKCGAHVDVDAIERDREQLFAEALQRFEAGEQWWMSVNEDALAKIEQADRLEVDVWESPIAKWLQMRSPERAKKETPLAEAWTEGVTTADVIRYALDKPAERQTKADANRASRIMRKLGWASVKRGDRRWFPER